MWGLEEVFGEGIFWRAAWLADTGASHSKQAAQLSRGLLCLLCACGVPGSWDLSMEVPCFVDGWGFEKGCPQNRVVFEGAVPERGVFWARVEVLMRRAWRWRGKKYESWLLGRDSMWDCLLCGWRL